MAPRTVVVAGQGGPSLTFTIPNNVDFDVQSVLADVDASGAGDTIGELAIADASGVVIATKRQGEPIPAGDTGTETWALRLTDEAAAIAAAGGYPNAVSGINGFYTVPSGVTTQFGVDDGAIATDFPAIFSTEEQISGGIYGIKIAATGTYAAFWGVQYQDRAGAPLANPETFVCEAEDASGSMFVGLPWIGSIFARGYTDFATGRSYFDISWISIFSIHNSTAPGDPIIISANQNTGVSLRAYTQLMVMQISPIAFF